MTIWIQQDIMFASEFSSGLDDDYNVKPKSSSVETEVTFVSCTVTTSLRSAWHYSIFTVFRVHRNLLIVVMVPLSKGNRENRVPLKKHLNILYFEAIPTCRNSNQITLYRSTSQCSPEERFETSIYTHTWYVEYWSRRVYSSLSIRRWRICLMRSGHFRLPI